MAPTIPIQVQTTSTHTRPPRPPRHPRHEHTTDHMHAQANSHHLRHSRQHRANTTASATSTTASLEVVEIGILVWGRRRQELKEVGSSMVGRAVVVWKCERARGRSGSRRRSCDCLVMV